MINNSKYLHLFCCSHAINQLMNSAEAQHMEHIMILILIMLTISPTTDECEEQA